MKSFKWIAFMALGALATGACQMDDGPAGVRQGDGAYRYVLGYDSDTGMSYTGGAHEVVELDSRGKADAIDYYNRADRLHPELVGDYTKFDASLTGGEAEWDVFPSSWWNQAGNGISRRWTGNAGSDYSDQSDKDDLSPTEKYDLLFHPGQSQTVAEVEHWNYPELLKDEDERGEKHKHPEVTVAGPATKWELENHGNYQSWAHPDSWWGHCNGWASYATAEPNSYPQRDIRVKLVNGTVTECVGELEGDADCILFRMGDIEALFSELYFSDQATFAGRRCDEDPDKIERDEFGRPVDPACRDLNAGAFHIGITGLLNRGANHLGTGEKMRVPFIIDHNYDWEVWNFPVNKYELLETEEISEEQANQLVGATGSDYQFNADAAKFVRVKLRYWMISDGVSWYDMLKRADERSTAPHQTDLNYVLELDASDTILGGEWIKDPEVTWGEDNKKLHPDFFWIAVQNKGAGESADDTGGNDDNPFISMDEARALLKCANDATTCAPAGSGGGSGGGGSEGGPDSCVDNCGGQASGGCYCDSVCSQYGDCCGDYSDVCVSGGDGGGNGGGDPEPLSCAGSCGSSASDGNGNTCWCDDQCEGYGDCCDDYAATCN